MTPKDFTVFPFPIASLACGEWPEVNSVGLGQVQPVQSVQGHPTNYLPAPRCMPAFWPLINTWLSGWDICSLCADHFSRLDSYQAWGLGSLSSVTWGGCWEDPGKQNYPLMAVWPHGIVDEVGPRGRAGNSLCELLSPEQSDRWQQRGTL